MAPLSSREPHKIVAFSGDLFLSMSRKPLFILCLDIENNSLRVFFQSIPDSLYESARIDGATEFRMLTRIALPIAKSGIVTIAFFIILMYWNDAQTALIYTDDPALTPLQLMLTRLVNYVQYIKQSEIAGGLIATDGALPENSLIFAMCCIATGPMLVVFSFVQKYFVRGLTSGAVKE